MPPQYLKIRIPRIPAGLIANLLGLAGLIGFAVCIGGLAGNWWVSGAIGAVFAVGLSWMANSAPAASVAAPAGGNIHQLAPAGARSA